MKTGAIILSAGKSSRLGKPKQLLVYEGETLIERAIGTALEVNCDPIIVVLGAYQKELQQQIRGTAAQIIENPDWEQGMGSSIGAGIKALQKWGKVDQVIIMLSDQPFVTPTHLEALINTKEISQKEIIASLYKNQRGVPVLFDHSCFEMLEKLKGTDGAKKLINSQKEKVKTVKFEKGKIDIDTEADFDALIRSDWGHFD